MSCLFDQVDGVRAFMKRGIVHDNDGLGRELGDEIALKPEIEDVSICVARGQTDGSQNASQDRPQHIHPPTGVPVLLAKTPFTTR